MKFLPLILLLPFYVNADVMDDFDSLGGNKALLEKAQALHPQTKIQIIQKRVVNRHKRHEFLGAFDHTTSGGNPYVETNSGGVAYKFHLNPRWSFGLSYAEYFNELTSEGRDLIARAELEANAENPKNDFERDDQPFIPEMNWPKASYIANFQWYPIYGKMGLLNSGVVHFDVYSTVGAGKTQLRFNESTIYEVGLGLGIWWSQHLTSRLEVNYLTYNAEYFGGARKIENTSLGFSMGYML